jgi:peptide-methionine (R)-S-oxide reductase
MPEINANLRWTLQIIVVVTGSLLPAILLLDARAEDRPRASTAPTAAPAPATTAPAERITRTDAEWRRLLSDEQYHILREKGTEPAFHNAYWDNHARGTYVCAGCGFELFESDKKFDSGTGWPSFWTHVSSHVEQSRDADGERTELLCARCGGHLGHVFDDGPKPTGLRYCIDSAALKFVPKK